jgi:hypothetical protein
MIREGPIPAFVHGIYEYLGGIGLVVAPLLIGYDHGAATAASIVRVARADSPVTRIRDLSLELVGQSVNSPPGVTPPTSTQYGYVSYLRGLPIFKGEPENETTAVLTFFADATTTRVIVDGPLRVLMRTGTIAFYLDRGANGSFANADSFRDGTRVLVAGFRQQVVLDTLTNTFTTHHLNTITATMSFRAGRGQVQLGAVRDRFVTILSGHTNMPAPPSTYFAGYTFSS